MRQGNLPMNLLLHVSVLWRCVVTISESQYEYYYGESVPKNIEGVPVFPSESSPVSCYSALPGAKDRTGVTIKVGYRNWDSHKIMTHVAEIVLKEFMRFDVQRVNLFEGKTPNYAPEIAAGAYDSDLEQWQVSAISDTYKTYVADKRGGAADLGPSGYIGRSGIFTTVADDLSQYYKFYQDTSLLKVNNMLMYGDTDIKAVTAQAGETFPICDKTKTSWCSSGEFEGYWVPDQCKSAPEDCAEIFMQTPGFDEAYFEQLTRNLGLKAIHGYYQYGGVKQIIKTSAGRGILFYAYEPDSLLASLNTVARVSFPDDFHGCDLLNNKNADTGMLSCDYKETALMKIGKRGLRKRAPEAWFFLNNLRISKADMQTMLGWTLPESENLTPDQAACKYIKANYGTPKFDAFLPSCVVLSSADPRSGDLVFDAGLLGCVAHTEYASTPASISCFSSNPGTKDRSSEVIKVARRGWLSHSAASLFAEVVLKQYLRYSVEEIDVSEGDTSKWGPEMEKGLYDLDLEAWQALETSDAYKQYVLSDPQIVAASFVGYAGRSGIFLLDATGQSSNPLSDYFRFFSSATRIQDIGALRFGESNNLTNVLGASFPQCTKVWCGTGQFQGYWVPPQCQSAPQQCAEVFMESSAVDAGYFEQLTKNHGLMLAHGYYGDKLQTIVQSKKDLGSRVLFYGFEPDPFLERVGATRVSFPDWTLFCDEGNTQNPNTGTVECDYHDKPLQKLVRSSLRQRAPEAWYFLNQFQLLRTQLRAMVQNSKEGGGTLNVEEAVCEFVKDNTDLISEMAPDCIVTPNSEEEIRTGGEFFDSDLLRCVTQICPAGTVKNGFVCEKCPGGRFANTTASMKCFDCPAGYVATDEGSEACTPCGPGKFSGSEGQSQCRLCPGGHFADMDATKECKLCDPGRITNVEGSKDCEDCTKGTFSEWGARRCLNCRVGTYEDQESSSQCKTCETGAVCTEMAMVKPTNEEGYWLGMDNNLQRCIERNECESEETCYDGQTGHLCRVCLPHHARGIATRFCYGCPSKAVDIVFVIIAFVIFVCFVLIVTYIVIHAASRPQDIYPVLIKQILSYFSSMMAVCWVLKRLMEKKSVELDDKSGTLEVVHVVLSIIGGIGDGFPDVLRVECMMQPSMSTEMESQLAELADIKHSQYYQPFLESARAALEQFHRDAETSTVLFWICLPLLIIFVLHIIGFIVLRRRNSKNRLFYNRALEFYEDVRSNGFTNAKNDQKGTVWKAYMFLYQKRTMNLYRAVKYADAQAKDLGFPWPQFLSESRPLSIVAIFLLYGTLVRGVIRPLTCMSLGKGLPAQVTTAAVIECYHANDGLFWLSLIAAISLGLVVPSIVFFRMHRVRNHLHEENVMLSWGLLFNGYKPRFWWFELFVFTRKTVSFLVAIIDIGGLGRTTLMMSLAVLVCIVITLHFEPFDSRYHNLLHRFEMRGLSIWMMSCICLMVIELSDSPPVILFLVIVISIAHIIYLVMAIYLLYVHLRAAYIDSIKKRASGDFLPGMWRSMLEAERDANRALPNICLYPQQGWISIHRGNHKPKDEVAAEHDQPVPMTVDRLQGLMKDYMQDSSLNEGEEEQQKQEKIADVLEGTDGKEGDYRYLIQIVQEVIEHLLVHRCVVQTFSSSIFEFVLRAGMVLHLVGKEGVGSDGDKGYDQAKATWMEEDLRRQPSVGKRRTEMTGKDATQRLSLADHDIHNLFQEAATQLKVVVDQSAGAEYSRDAALDSRLQELVKHRVDRMVKIMFDHDNYLSGVPLVQMQLNLLELAKRNDLELFLWIKMFERSYLQEKAQSLPTDMKISLKSVWDKISNDLVNRKAHTKDWKKMLVDTPKLEREGTEDNGSPSKKSDSNGSPSKKTDSNGATPEKYTSNRVSSNLSLPTGNDRA